jgi:hypothetical protein
MEKVYLVITELKNCLPAIDMACASFSLADKVAHDLIDTFDAPYNGYLWIHQEVKCGDTLQIFVWGTDVNHKEFPVATIKVISMPLMQ